MAYDIDVDGVLIWAESDKETLEKKVFVRLFGYKAWVKTHEFYSRHEKAINWILSFLIFFSVTLLLVSINGWRMLL